MGTRRKVGENKHSQGGTNDRKAQVLSFLHMQLHLLSANVGDDRVREDNSTQIKSDDRALRVHRFVRRCPQL